MTTLTVPTLVIDTLTPAQIWERAADQLKGQLDPRTFHEYIRGCRVYDFSGDVFSIATPTQAARDWIASRLTSIIRHHLEPLVGRPIQVDFVYSSPPPPPKPAEPALSKPKKVKPASDPAKSTAKKTKIPRKSSKEAVTAQMTPGAVATSPVISEFAVDEDNQQAHNAVDSVDAAESAPETECETAGTLQIEEIADSVEAALQGRGRYVAFPRYELRHIPLVGPEAFFLRVAFLQERFFHTPADGRARPFETSVESLLRWANVGRATLHRFKKGDPARGTQPAAGWFGIEQLPSAPRTGASQQQPPCRYRLQQGIPLTPMDADHLYALLIEAGIQTHPLEALQSLCRRPVQEILQFPPPAPSDEHKRRAPEFISAAGVVQSALGRVKIPSEARAEVQEWVNKLADHITMPQQMILVSWYFLQEWLPVLGHDAAALVLYSRAQGYYNPQDQELRDEILVSGGYSELAQVIGLKRDRTIGDWLPNIFDRTSGRDRESSRRAEGEADSDKWLRAQARQQQIQANIGRFIQVLPGSRKKMPAGHYAFRLHLELKGEPLTPTDQTLCSWVYRTLAECDAQGVLAHFHAWVTSPVIAIKAAEYGERPQNEGNQNDGAGTLHSLLNHNDGWGILAAREMTAGESDSLDNDGWGILDGILNDGMGILAGSEMTARELFKGLLRLNTFWKTLPDILSTTLARPLQTPVVGNWDLSLLCLNSGGLNPYRQKIIAAEKSAAPFISWLLYAYSIKGRGIEDPFGWALARIKDQPGAWAGDLFADLANRPPADLAHLLDQHIQSGAAPYDDAYRPAFQDAPIPKLRDLARILAVGEGEKEKAE